MKFLAKLFILILLAFISINSQVPRETRAVWVTTNYKLDWLKTTHPRQQKQNFSKIIDYAKRNNINTIFLQVRSNGSVIYYSSYEPFSPYMTGKLGEKPSYDLMKYAIDEAHENGLQIFAWINTLRGFVPSRDFNTENTNHIFSTKKEWLVKSLLSDKTQYWLDPGLPEVREYLVNVIDEMLLNYEVDGIILDFLRYPGRIFDDSFSYSAYGGTMERDEFKRGNINKFLDSLNSVVRKKYSELKVCVTPIGMNSSIGISKGGDGYSRYYQDVKTWIQNGWVDYLIPQIYWDTKNSPGFEEVLQKWEKGIGKDNLITALAAYKPSILDEIDRQIEIGRSHGISGVSLYRYSNIKDKRMDSFEQFALPPSISKLDSIKPLKPTNLGYSIKGQKSNNVTITWNNQKAKDDDYPGYIGLFRVENQKRRFGELFKAEDEELTFRITNPSNLKYNFILQSYDNAWNESDFTEVVTIKLPVLNDIAEKLTPIKSPVFLSTQKTILINSDEPEPIRIQYGKKVRKLEAKKGLNVVKIEDYSPPGRIKIEWLKSGRVFNLGRN